MKLSTFASAKFYIIIFFATKINPFTIFHTLHESNAKQKKEKKLSINKIF